MATATRSQVILSQRQEPSWTSFASMEHVDAASTSSSDTTKIVIYSRESSIGYHISVSKQYIPTCLTWFAWSGPWSENWMIPTSFPTPMSSTFTRSMSFRVWPMATTFWGYEVKWKACSQQEAFLFFLVKTNSRALSLIGSNLLAAARAQMKE